MRRIVIFMAIALLCSGCAMCRNCRNTALNSTDKRDSLIIKETIVYRDSLIPVLVKDTTAVVPPALFYLYMRQQERKPSIAKTLIFNSFLYNLVKT